MLHKIILPNSWIYLSWILSIQYRLLRYVCCEDITDEMLNKEDLDLLKEILPELSETPDLRTSLKKPRLWLRTLNGKYKERTLTQRLRTIARFDFKDIKKPLLEAFLQDVRLWDVFEFNDHAQTPFELMEFLAAKTESPAARDDNMHTTINAIKMSLLAFEAPSRLWRKAHTSEAHHSARTFKFSKLSFLSNEKSGSEESPYETVHLFFLSFYTRMFYDTEGSKSAKGYTIPIPENQYFGHDTFVSDYWRTNSQQLEVCPFCDGPTTESNLEVDHFYPKSKLPFLSCHPLNLIPMCETCNTAKSDALPFSVLSTEDDLKPLSEGLHPYLYSLVDQYEVCFDRVQEPNQSLCVLLEAPSEEEDSPTNKRIYRLMELVDLKKRWREFFKQVQRNIIRDILRVRRGKRLEGQNDAMDNDELIKELRSLKINTDIGVVPQGILRRAYLSRLIYSIQETEKGVPLDEIDMSTLETK